MVRITDVREITKPISSPIRNAYIDFTKMTTSLVAVVTDVKRDGKRVVGYGFNSNGRYGQGGLIRERFAHPGMTPCNSESQTHVRPHHRRPRDHKTDLFADPQRLYRLHQDDDEPRCRGH